MPSFKARIACCVCLFCKRFIHRYCPYIRYCACTSMSRFVTRDVRQGVRCGVHHTRRRARDGCLPRCVIFCANLCFCISFYLLCYCCFFLYVMLCYCISVSLQCHVSAFTLFVMLCVLNDSGGAGIDATREPTLMWIAKFALTEPLPLEWEEYAPIPLNRR